MSHAYNFANKFPSDRLIVSRPFVGQAHSWVVKTKISNGKYSGFYSQLTYSVIEIYKNWFHNPQM